MLRKRTRKPRKRLPDPPSLKPTNFDHLFGGPRGKVSESVSKTTIGPGKTTPLEVVKERVRVSFDNRAKGLLPYEPKYLTADVRCRLGIRLMRSERWFPGHSDKKSLRSIPFINNGHITSQTLGFWHCTKSQFFATVTRQVHDALVNRVYSSNKRKNRKRICRDLLTRIAIFYTSTLDDSKLERLLKCHPKRCRSLLFHYICEMDEQKRFLYGQMLQSILWLQSRGNPRAKSILKTFIPRYRNLSVKDFSTVGYIKRSLDAFGDPWIVRCEKAPLTAVRDPYPRIVRVSHGRR